MLAAALVASVLTFSSAAAPRFHDDLHVQIAALSRALEEEPARTDLLALRAELHRLHGKPLHARADFERALALAPELPGPALGLARLDFACGAIADARRRLEVLLEREPHDSNAWLLYAEALARAGEVELAARGQARALALLDAPRPEHYARWAELESALGEERAGAALGALDAGLARLGSIPVLELRALEIELALGRFEAALARVEHLAARSARAEHWLALRGDVLARAGREDEARGAWRAAGAAIEALPAKQRRARAVRELEIEVASKLAGGAACVEAFSPVARASSARDPLLLAAVLSGAPPRACAPATGSAVLIHEGSSWKYLDDGSDQGTAWREPGFDDSGWAAGPAQLGYGDGDEATVVSYGPDPDDKFITTYFRHTFTVADPAPFLSLSLELLRDDGALAYLNGVEIARSNMPAGSIGYLTLAASAVSGSDEDAFFSFGADAALLVPGTNVLAVEIHQSTGTSSDISFDLALAAFDELFVTRGPYLQIGTATSVRVRWRTNGPTGTRVWIGATPGALSVAVDDPALVTEHDVELAGLTPATRYFYAVGDADGMLAGDDPEHTFATPPTASSRTPFRAWVLGDSGTADANAAAVRDAYYAFAGGTPTDLWLMLGDNAYVLGFDEEYQAAVFEMYPEMLRRSVLWPTRGNHDTVPGVYYGIFSMPAAGEAGGVPSGTEAYYSFDWANVHFVCLDSQGSDRSVGGAMWTWLRSDLASTAQEWIVAFWHHPPYSKGEHDSDTELRLIEMRENFLPLLEASGVDLVLAGHSHSYERSFLIDGHYGHSTTFGPQHFVNAGDGRSDGTGIYVKGAGPHAGAVYTVAGSSGQVSGGTLDHPAMFVSFAELGSVVLDVDGGRMDVLFLDSEGGVPDRFTLANETYEGSYCVSYAHSDGCAATISTTGSPSATDPAPFAVAAIDALPHAFGLLFYGLGPEHMPFSNGLRCIAAPVRRVLPQISGDGTGCAGNFHVDFNALIRAGNDLALVPGAVVGCQYWFRDPQDGAGSAVTDAVQFAIGP